MLKSNVLIVNKAGLHARPIQMIIEVIGKFDCEVRIGKTEDSFVDASSMLSLMTLGGTNGTELIIEVDGDDEAALTEELVQVFASGFGED